jgi:hypothetical protein
LTASRSFVRGTLVSGGGTDPAAFLSFPFIES